MQKAGPGEKLKRQLLMGYQELLNLTSNLLLVSIMTDLLVSLPSIPRCSILYISPVIYYIRKTINHKILTHNK